MAALRLLVSLVFSLLVAGDCLAQRIGEGPEAALIEAGFENVAVVRQNNRVVATFENRRYRYEVEAVHGRTRGIACRRAGR